MRFRKVQVVGLALSIIAHGSVATRNSDPAPLVSIVQRPESRHVSARSIRRESSKRVWEDLGVPVAHGHVNHPLQTLRKLRNEPVIQPPPPGPTQAEWALASKYTLKNSKAYRYAWALEVRSRMGAAVDGKDQGAVRFRFEISSDGKLASLRTIWTTSDVVEARARRAIAEMPPTPPTPTAKPLIFEKTIVFSPLSSEMPPSYRDDCMPEAPSFRNPFAWDGHSPQTVETGAAPEPMSQEDIEKCRSELPPETVEGEAGRDQRELDRWDSPRLGH